MTVCWLSSNQVISVCVYLLQRIQWAVPLELVCLCTCIEPSLKCLCLLENNKQVTTLINVVCIGVCYLLFSIDSSVGISFIGFCRWYTSMLGKKSSLKTLMSEIEKYQVSSMRYLILVHTEAIKGQQM